MKKILIFIFIFISFNGISQKVSLKELLDIQNSSLTEINEVNNKINNNKI